MAPGEPETDLSWRVSTRESWSRLTFPGEDREADSLDWFRAEFRAAFRPSKPWELELIVPFDLKRVAHTDGSTETKTGISDIQQWVSVSIFELFTETDELQFGAGLSFPTGAANPEGQGSEEEALLFGSGTFDPALRLRYAFMPDWWGLGFSVSGQLPTYANRWGYRAPIVGEGSVNFRIKPLDWFAADIACVGQVRGDSYLDGMVSAGYSSVLLVLSPSFVPSDWAYITPSFGYRLATFSDEEDVQARLQFVVSIRATFTW